MQFSLARKFNTANQRLHLEKAKLQVAVVKKKSVLISTIILGSYRCGEWTSAKYLPAYLSLKPLFLRGNRRVEPGHAHWHDGGFAH